MSEEAGHDALKLARLSIENQFCSLDDAGSLQCLDPESCVQALRDPWQVTGVKKQIRLADASWLRSFLDAGGLDALWNTLEACSTGDVLRPTALLRCTECAKALLSHSDALEYLISRSSTMKYVDRLLLVMDLPTSPDNALVKIHPLLILSVIARHSEEGFKTTITAFDNYKTTKQLRHRFSFLVLELSSPHSPPEYQAVIIAFINYLVASCDNISERVKLRSALNALQLSEIFHTICDKDDIPESLLQQLQIYRKKQEQDEEHVKTPGGINLTNHEDVFRAVFEKFFNTEHSAPLLSVLQKLLLLERDSSKTDAIFQSLDCFLERALTISEPGQADRISQVTIEKLKKVMEVEDLRKSEIQTNMENKTIEEKSETEDIPDTTPTHPAPPPPIAPPPPPNSPLAPPPPNSIPAPPPPNSPPAPPPPPNSPPAPPPPPNSPPAPPPPPNSPPAPPPPNSPPAPPPPSNGVPDPPIPSTTGPTNTEDTDNSSGLKLWGVAKVVLTIFQRARQCRPSVKMKRMNWKKIPEGVAKKESAIWHDTTDSKVELPFEVDNIREAVEKFFHNEFKSVNIKDKSDGPKQVELDSGASMSINILLNDLKSVSTPSIMMMIKTGLPQEGRSLLAHHLDAIEKAMEKKEVAQLSEFDGDPSALGKPERFVLELTKVPWCLFRVKVLKLQLTFDETIELYTTLYNTFMLGFDELLKSESLKQILFIILLIGNIINGNNNQGEAYGFSITSLQQLTALVANVSSKGTNFMHYLITIIKSKLPELLNFPSELPHLYQLSRVPFKDITKEVIELREQLTGYKETLEGGDPPSDLADQMNIFIPNADGKLSKLEQYIESVKEKSAIVAEYFCDDRSDFINEVFVEMWNFVDVFEKATKDVNQNAPIPSSCVKPEAEITTNEPTEEDKYKHTKAAIRAITSEDFDVATPPELLPLQQSSGEMWGHLATAEYHNTTLSTLEEVEDVDYAEEEQPMTLSSAALKTANKPGPNSIPKVTLLTPSSPPAFSRGVSVGADKLKMFRKHSASSIDSKETVMNPRSLPGLYRSVSVQPLNRSSNLFGSSIHDVERILFRMADAIKKDLEIQ